MLVEHALDIPCTRVAETGPSMGLKTEVFTKGSTHETILVASWTECCVRDIRRCIPTIAFLLVRLWAVRDVLPLLHELDHRTETARRQSCRPEAIFHPFRAEKAFPRFLLHEAGQLEGVSELRIVDMIDIAPAAYREGWCSRVGEPVYVNRQRISNAFCYGSNA